MKTMLYATDYSQNSIPALQLANTMATKLEAKLIVMHVFDIPISLASPVSISYLKKENKLFATHRAKLKRFCEEHLNHQLDGRSLTFMVHEDGSVPNGILEIAFKLDVDLIVVGAKGSSQIKEFVLGSTPMALLRNSSCPILVVPSKWESNSLKNIVYATDFEQADIFAIMRLVELAKTFGAKITVVHITPLKEYAGQDQMEWFKELLTEKIKYDKLEFCLIFSDTVFEELVGYLEEDQTDLLAMLERKESTLYQKYLQPDLVKKMVKTIEIPVLSYSVGGL